MFRVNCVCDTSVPARVVPAAYSAVRGGGRVAVPIAALEVRSTGCETPAVAYANDVGGMHGFGDLPEGGGPTFESVWEAQTFVLNQAFVAAGAYTLDEFRATMERIPPAEYYAMPYYERWLTALEHLVGEQS